TFKRKNKSVEFHIVHKLALYFPQRAATRVAPECRCPAGLPRSHAREPLREVGTMTTEERFERIESTLVRITDRMDRMSETHVELETAQVNLQRAQTRIAEGSREWRTDF